MTTPSARAIQYVSEAYAGMFSRRLSTEHARRLADAALTGEAEDKALLSPLQTAAAWRPIDATAHDGSDYLLLMRDTDVCIVASYDRNKEFYPWETLDGPSYGGDAFSHYMFLPPPPEK